MIELHVVSREPESPSIAPPLLLVHGAWHGAWCWEEHWLPFLAEEGFSVRALDLRGHGASAGRRRLRRWTIGDYVEDVLRVADDLPEPPVLVGHSMGGYVVQRILARRRFPAAVLVTPVPPTGVLGITLRVARHHPGAFLRANLTASLWPIVADRERATRLLFRPGTDPTSVARHLDRLQDESYLAYLDMFRPLRRPLPSTPVLVVAAGADGIVSPAENRRTVARYDAALVELPDAGHDVMLDPDRETAARAVVDWVRETVGLG